MPLIRTQPTGANDPWQNSLQTLNNLLDCEFGMMPKVPGLILHRGTSRWESLHVGGIGLVVDSIVEATATLDLLAGDFHVLTLDNAQTIILALANPTLGQEFKIALKQDATGTCLVTWFDGVLWPAATPPTLTTAAGKYDVFGFKCIAVGVYLSLYTSQAL